MFKNIMATRADVGPLIIRLGLGAVIWPHGAQKVMGLFHGPGFSQTLKTFETHFGIPTWATVLVMAAEFLGAIGLVVGCFTRVAAAGIVAVMIGAIHMAHWQNGFFMNWYGKQTGEGFEYHLLVIAMALALIFTGAGAFSIDRQFGKKP
jgi:putative oxidoreductase